MYSGAAFLGALVSRLPFGIGGRREVSVNRGRLNPAAGVRCSRGTSLSATERTAQCPLTHGTLSRDAAVIVPEQSAEPRPTLDRAEFDDEEGRLPNSAERAEGFGEAATSVERLPVAAEQLLPGPLAASLGHAVHELRGSGERGRRIPRTVGRLAAPKRRLEAAAHSCLTMSTEIFTAGIAPLFSSQWVVFLSSGQPTPGP